MDFCCLRHNAEQRRYQPETTRADTLRFLSQLISSPCASAVSPRGGGEVAARSARAARGRLIVSRDFWICAGDKSGRCERTHQQYLQRVTGASPGKRLSLEPTRKEPMGALIVATPCIDCPAAEPAPPPKPRPPGSTWWGRGGRGLSQPLAGASVSGICLSSSFVLLRDAAAGHQAQEIYAAAEPSGISAAHRPND